MTAPAADWSRVWELLRPHRRTFVVAGLLAAVVAACQGATVLLVRDVLDRLLRTGDPRAAWAIPLAIGVLFSVLAAARAGRLLLTRSAAYEAEAALRQRLLAHLLALSPEDVDAEGRGASAARLVRDAGAVRAAVGAAVTAVQRPASALAVAAAALATAPRLALVAALVLPVVAWVIHRSGRLSRDAARDHGAAVADADALARDSLDGHRTLQLAGAARRLVERFAQRDASQVAAALRATRARAVGPAMVELAVAAAFAGVIAVGARDVAAGQLTPGALLAFLVAVGLIHEPLKGIAALHALLQEARGGLDRVFEVLDRPPPPRDAPDARPLPSGGVTLRLAGVSADRGRGPILDDVDLRVEPGDVVVIQGASGAGKSTLLSVIAGFLPHGGRVEWSGEPPERWTRASRHAALAWVEQQPWLGMGTIREALTFGRPISEERLADALRQAGLDDAFLARLPRGLDTAVGDGGAGLSGGERQRLSLARALVAGPAVLLLDEPTSQLDDASERAFLADLAAGRQGRSVILVTHRPGPLAIATQAWQLSGGRLLPLTLSPPARPTNPAAPR